MEHQQHQRTHFYYCRFIFRTVTCQRTPDLSNISFFWAWRYISTLISSSSYHGAMDVDTLHHGQAWTYHGLPGTHFRFSALLSYSATGPCLFPSYLHARARAHTLLPGHFSSHECFICLGSPYLVLLPPPSRVPPLPTFLHLPIAKQCQKIDSSVTYLNHSHSCSLVLYLGRTERLHIMYVYICGFFFRCVYFAKKEWIRGI
ncbi:hypothetical protein BD769DRAFT_529858 [Suillus cothurnatus]|jgi:hypothetical protein|nr:hypothetical protein BD769DRAFT_529858 [Suillus cothurnatus]